MTKLKRFTGKVFGGSATAVGDDPQIAQFGSALANTFVGTTDPEIIQQLPAWGQGWIGAVTPTQQYPALPEMTGAMKVLSHQICGILQQGVSTWDSGTIYYAGNFVSLNGRLYVSQIDENQGNNPSIDAVNWKEFSSGGGGLEIGDIGIAPLGIDETQGKRRYLNGQIIIQNQFISFSEKVKSAIALYPTLGCTEQEWQTTATMSVGGQVGKFVVDNEGGTIRLPKIIMPIQGLTDLANLAEIVEAGLPAHTHTFSATTNSKGAHTHTFQVPEDAGSGGSLGKGMYNGPGNVWSPNYTTSSNGAHTHTVSGTTGSYGTLNTVQQEQIQYPYFIQVATGAEESVDVTRATEIITPYFFGMSQYFESAPNNPSWVKSQGQYNSKEIYPDYYDWLLKIYNGTETQEGVSVKLATESYTDYDFVINQADETFRLPLLNGSEAIVGDRVQDFGNPASDTNHIAPANGWFNLHRTATANNQYIYLGTNEITKQSESVASGTNLRIDIEVKRGDSVLLSYNAPTAGYFRFIYAKGNGDLYYYVGDGIVNPQLVNVARIEEVKANKTDVDGQWINYSQQILASTGLNATTNLKVDLSDILPNDGYRYECIFDMYVSTGSTSGNTAEGALMTDEGMHLTVCSCVARTAATYKTSGSAILPIGLGRYVEVYRYASWNGTTNLDLIAYRRIGKNV